jgi:multiple sugar transport system ATP-binding protein
MAAVTFTNVSKRYESVSVIESLNLEVRDHELMVLVGPSGCGKSTALRMIAGLEEISSGTISIGERVVNNLAPRDRDIAMVFQSYALYPHMTVRGNLEFGLRMRKVAPPEIDKRVDDAAEILGITHLLGRKPKDLSGGQRQRVAVGRAIVRQPAVFLFDEPLSNLDAKLRVQMRAEITQLQQRLQTTSVYVTHDQIEAMTMGHRIAVMREGKIQQVGTPLEIYARPDNLFVAQFIGTPPMNFVTGTVWEHGTAIRTLEFELPVPERLRSGLPPGRRVIVGIRPEHVGPVGTEPGRTIVIGRVELVELIGHQIIVHTRIGEDIMVASLDPRLQPRIGDALSLSIENDAIQLFDAESELRIG